ncbi:hypothetical protein FLAG1_07780 [Fusarium langsethiae]|uniref:Uncharacterized protein n=1 Tax=Fusarium langsethiae TaxID=179993 RepID=A0A0N1J2J0_FUSLA|nr:hypothetical protein FLAG1_07780 [Fusarium langsethiae]GKU03927.1 unnamed protein product [Fusarium langsethiae]GKU18859.1 unnamed protein product [Fusarium langsethiae]
MEPFSEQEKRQLLTEIIKHSQIDNYHLYRIIGYYSVAPNWFHLALPNGRTLAQCQATLARMGNELSAQAAKRKAPGDGQSSEGGNGVQSSGPQEPRAQPQPTAAQDPQINAQRQSAIPMNTQQYQYQSGPPPKKKGRPAYSGRNAMGPRPFNPRALAPMPNQQVVQNAQPSFRPIAPAPQLYSSTIAAIEPVGGMNQEVMCATTTQQQGGMGLPTPQVRMAMEEMARQRGDQQALAALSRLPGQASNRSRSNSEAVPSASKQEENERGRSHSVELIETNEETSTAEDDKSEQKQQHENGTPNPSKGLRRSQRKA